MSKSFVDWLAEKSRIEERAVKPFFREQEVWWCSIGTNVGVEQDGKGHRFERPVIVFRKFNEQMLWVLPMTSRKKHGRFYFPIHLHTKEQIVVLSQLRVVSGKRLIRRVGKISDSAFSALEQAFSIFLKETDPLRGPRVPNGNSNDTITYVWD